MADVISCQSDKRMRWCSVPERVQLHMAMLALQFGYAGFHVVSRFALNMGISKIVFIVYRNIIAFLLLAPFAYFLEKKDRPKITINFLIQFFFLALVGITANQSFYMLGLENTSPTFASAIQNSVPAITFLMAVILRIEKVRLDRKDGLAKVFGTVFCVAGASVITLFKGPPVYTPRPPLQATGVDLLSFVGQTLGSEEGKNWTLGCMFLIGHCLSWSGWLVLQAPVLKKYPARLSVTSYTCFFGLIQFLVISAFIERDPNAWIVRSGGEVFSIFYAGVVASGIAFAVQIWCIDRGGPVFVAVYQPVQTLVVAIMASVALGEEFYLGGLVIVPLLNLLLILSFISVRWLRTLLLTGSDRIIGAALIVVGLYLVLWGKNEERKYAIEKATILSDPNHVCDAEPSLIKPTLTRPLLPPSTENV